MFVALRGTASTTSCSVPAPCARVRADSIIFIGTVIAADVPANDRDQTARIARVKVDEIFEGLPKGAAEVTVSSDGSLARGKTYLFDVGRDDDGSLEPTMCGSTGELDADYVADFLRFLRMRKAGKATTSLFVYVNERNQPVSDVKVRIVGGAVERAGTTDPKGVAVFSPVAPGSYHIDVNREFYDLDPESTESQTVDVINGTCAGTRIGVTAQGVVSGFVKDARNMPMAHLPVDLNIIGDRAGRSTSGWFSAETDESGAFRFMQVSPGRYYVGTNLLDYSRSAPVPRVYYPGSRSPDGAAPIEVRPGGKVENLILTMPDFGALRPIKLIVVDETGRPAAGAVITNARGMDPDRGELRGLKTSDQGIAVAQGFEGVHYRVSALVRAADFRHSLFSAEVDIPPGKGLFEGVLIVRPLSIGPGK